MKKFTAYLILGLACVYHVAAQDFPVIPSFNLTANANTTVETSRVYSGYIDQIDVEFTGISPTVDVQVIAVANESATAKTLLDIDGSTTNGQYVVRQPVVTYTNSTIANESALFPLIQQSIRVVASNYSDTVGITGKVFIVIGNGY